MEVIRSEPTPVGPTCSHACHVPARFSARSHRQALGVDPVVCAQEWPALSLIDCGWRDLRIRTVRCLSPLGTEEVRDGLDGLRLSGRLVGTEALHSCEAEREAGWVTRRFLYVTERNLDDDLWSNEYRLIFPVSFEGEQLFRLSAQHLVGQAFECFAQHHELPTCRITCAKMQI